MRVGISFDCVDTLNKRKEQSMAEMWTLQYSGENLKLSSDGITVNILINCLLLDK